jgi:hypothetical protein
MSMSSDRSRGVRVLSLAFASLFVLLCLIAVLIYLGWHGKPAHWEAEQTRLAAVSQAERQAVSESFQNRFLTKWSDPGEATPVTEDDLFGQRAEITVPFDELNTWIQSEGLSLLEELGVEMPATAPTLMIDSPGDGLLRISFEIVAENVQQVVTLSFLIAIDADGTITSTLKRATAGRLPLPTDTAIEIIASQSDEGLLMDLMRGEPIDPLQLPIDPSRDGLRDGRIVGLEVTNDAMLLTRETVRRDKK